MISIKADDSAYSLINFQNQVSYSGSFKKNPPFTLALI